MGRIYIDPSLLKQRQRRRKISAICCPIKIICWIWGTTSLINTALMFSDRLQYHSKDTFSAPAINASFTFIFSLRSYSLFLNHTKGKRRSRGVLCVEKISRYPSLKETKLRKEDFLTQLYSMSRAHLLLIVNLWSFTHILAIIFGVSICFDRPPPCFF